MKNIKSLLIIAILAISFSSCSDDDSPTAVNEEEVITTVRFVLSPVAGGASVVMQSQDLDGDGPDAPVVTIMGTVLASTQYSGSVQFLNELETPAEDITLEVIEEADEHQVFYALTGSSNSTITYNDLDADGNPIGVDFVFNSGIAGSDNVAIVTLRHEPNKGADGVSDGIIDNAGGETDVEVVFNYTVSN